MRGIDQVLSIVLQSAKFNPRYTRLITTTQLCSKRFGSYTCTSTNQRAIHKQHTPSHDSLLHHRVVAVLAPSGADVAERPEEIAMREARAAPASDVGVHAGKKLKIGRKHDVARTEGLQVGRQHLQGKCAWSHT